MAVGFLVGFGVAVGVGLGITVTFIVGLDIVPGFAVGLGVAVAILLLISAFAYSSILYFVPSHCRYFLSELLARDSWSHLLYSWGGGSFVPLTLHTHYTS